VAPGASYIARPDRQRTAELKELTLSPSLHKTKWTSVLLSKEEKLEGISSNSSASLCFSCHSRVSFAALSSSTAIPDTCPVTELKMKTHKDTDNFLVTV
jgi:hypothetical protein